VRPYTPIHRGHDDPGVSGDILHRSAGPEAGEHALRRGDDERIAHRIGAQLALACGRRHILD
jgi:hypothetical protein